MAAGEDLDELVAHRGSGILSAEAWLLWRLLEAGVEGSEFSGLASTWIGEDGSGKRSFGLV